MDIQPISLVDLVDKVFNKRPKRYGKRTLPCAFDAILSNFIDDLMTMPEAGRREVCTCLNIQQRGILRAYAMKMAALAVRRNSSKDILYGIVALSLGEDQANGHEELIISSLLRHSAKKIGVSYNELLSEATEYVAGFATRLLDKLRVNQSTIYQMGFVESFGENGFEYQPAR